MHHPNNGQRSYKLQTKHAERMILPSSSQKYSRTYLWVRGSWKTDRRKSRTSLPRTVDESRYVQTLLMRNKLRSLPLRCDFTLSSLKLSYCTWQADSASCSQGTRAHRKLLHQRDFSACTDTAIQQHMKTVQGSASGKFIW